MNRFFNYILTNLRDEVANFPLWIPVFMGIGIGYYFHLFNEPKMWLVSIVFAISLFVLVFVNFGNSSEKIRHYKKLFAWSTLKFIIRKLFKFFIFFTLLPIFGNIAILVFIATWIFTTFRFSRYIKYFAFLYDNTLMKYIFKVMIVVFGPLIKWILNTALFSYFKKIAKTSKAKTKKREKLWKVIWENMKHIYSKILYWISAFFNLRFFRWINYIKEWAFSLLIKIKDKFLEVVYHFIPAGVLKGAVKFIFSLNFILFFCVLGFFIITLRTNRLDTKLLDKKIYNASVEARLIATEFYDDAFRFTFDNVKINGSDEIKVDKIRVKFFKNFGLPVIGETLKFRTTLLPPFEPEVVGGFNFARYSFYKKFSASGRSNNAWVYTNTSVENSLLKSLYFDFLNMRNDINGKIEEFSSPSTSGVIMSMMTGERYSIPKEIAENYNGAGISHLLSISGIHMTLIVGVAFLFVRLILSCITPISRKYNTKKIAVFVAIFVALFYLFLSGARLPTQRAFIMMMFGLGAILLDRNPLSLRFLGMTAIILLLFTPEALINAGFQMSFVAVVALIKLYEVRDKWLIKIPELKGIRKVGLNLLNILWANILTAVSIGIVITPFIIFNFNNVQLYSVIGNLFAIPLCSLFVMPMILLSFVLLPFGGEAFSIKLVEYGVLGINFIASRVSQLPFSHLEVKSMTLLPLLLIVFGLLWFFLWNKRWRFFGIIVAVVGFGMYIFSPTPSIFVNKYGRTFAVKSGNELEVINYSKYKPYYRLLNDWRLRSGVQNIQDSEEKYFEINNTKIAIIDRYQDYKTACVESDIIFTTFDPSKAYYKCSKPTFGKLFFAFAKGSEFWIGDGKAEYKTIREFVGNRPWSMVKWDRAYKLPKELLKELMIFK